MRKRPVNLPWHRLGREGKPALHIRQIHADAPLAPSIEPVHRDAYYLFLLQQAGESTYMIDFADITLRGCCLHVIRPGQAHRFLNADAIDGWLVALEADLVPTPVRNTLETSVVPLPLSPVAMDQLERIVTALQDALIPSNAMEGLVMQYIAAAFSASVANLYQQQDNTGAKTRAFAVTQQLKQLVGKHFREKKLPADYAGMMRLSPAYVNECVKATTGQPVTHWIQDALLLEARRMLAHSDKSIKEIAFDLGYADPAYFTRVFIKVQGFPPAAFRKTYRA